MGSTSTRYTIPRFYLQVSFFMHYRPRCLIGLMIVLHDVRSICAQLILTSLGLVILEHAQVVKSCYLIQ